MVKFLLNRPIAVFMAFVACLIIGLATCFNLPVSLLPDIDIPKITVRVIDRNSSARELENSVVSPLRRQLLQVSGLKEIESRAYDGSATVSLDFDFGTDTDLAFIEVNEKIDAAMGFMPKELERPKVIKASATDIPVLYINMTMKEDGGVGSEELFLEMCDMAENVVRRRIEQLPEIALADITGIPEKVLHVTPDKNAMSSMGITIADIENALEANNVTPGNMTVRDGYLQYNVKVSSQLRTIEDVEDIYIRKGDRLLQLKDIGEVSMSSSDGGGLSLAGGKRAVTIAVVKHGEEGLDDMRESLDGVLDHFSTLYPRIEFTVNRNQTELLDYTITNLWNNLLIGFVLVFVVAVIFLKDVRSPIAIGIGMSVSVVITFLFFRLFGLSLNIISLSGLILAVGMMIDNFIIFTENISQHVDRGDSLFKACVDGTTEMITPMLSSSLTTVAVFFPLIFMSGITGAMFKDQALSVTIGLTVSYLTGILFFPVLYYLMFKGKKRGASNTAACEDKNDLPGRLYDKAWNFTFAHKKVFVALALLAIPLCVVLFNTTDKSRMPEIEQSEVMVHMKWNENITLTENRERVERLLSSVESMATEHAAYVGSQDYMLDNGADIMPMEAEVYIKTDSPEAVEAIVDSIGLYMEREYASATVSFYPPENMFERLFPSSQADIVAHLYLMDRDGDYDENSVKEIEREICEATGVKTGSTEFSRSLDIVADSRKLLLYNVSRSEVMRALKTTFRDNHATKIHSFRQYVPVVIADKESTIDEVIAGTFVSSMPDENGDVARIPLSSLVTTAMRGQMGVITAGRDGEYIPMKFNDVARPYELVDKITGTVRRNDRWGVDFSGGVFDNEKMLGELVVILLASVCLMYFILCAQFESFVQPLIVLVEIPIDAAFALLALMACGYSLNLMSATGIIVTCGIIVNDSILKLDTINELRKCGMPVKEAIHTAGRRRLRAIIMTSLTTIFAMVPILFTSDMGSAMQKPLSVAMIGSMTVGTLVSLFIVPLIYWFVYGKDDRNATK